MSAARAVQINGFRTFVVAIDVGARWAMMSSSRVPEDTAWPEPILGQVAKESFRTMFNQGRHWWELSADESAGGALSQRCTLGCLWVA